MTIIPLSPAERRAGPRFPLWSLGFRPFFLGAGVFAVLAIGQWMAVFVFHRPLPLVHLTPFQWHAHEMIYGYGMAVIAGFLLTAVRNWTQIQTARGAALGVLFGLWAGARLCFSRGTEWAAAAAALDLMFAGGLAAAVVWPVVRARQWRQMGIMAKLVILTVGQAVFYWGVLAGRPRLVQGAVYGGLYVVIGLIMTMGARVLPNFIENAVGEGHRLARRAWLGAASLAFFLMFFVSELFLERPNLTALAAAGLVIVTTWRLADWHAAALWRKPLLWSLYLSFVFIDLGFLLFALRPWHPMPVFIPVHAMAFGGIGLVTMSMMARVALGHSGRDIRQPPRGVGYASAALTLGVVARVIMPLADPGRYTLWIATAQTLWMAAFLIFLISYAAILTGPDAG